MYFDVMKIGTCNPTAACDVMDTACYTTRAMCAEYYENEAAATECPKSNDCASCVASNEKCGMLLLSYAVATLLCLFDPFPF